ncbi:hypothetical protein [Streptomyces lunaelactis]|nr:hypothetical protein [Streptomyces lunaelactis]
MPSRPRLLRAGAAITVMRRRLTRRKARPAARRDVTSYYLQGQAA